MSRNMDVHLGRLERGLRSMGSVAVALSGGVDSSFLAAFAHHVLGGGAAAVIGVSPSLAKRELRDAQALATRTGLELVRLETDELRDERYVANGMDRCYYCKAALYDAVRAWATGAGFAHVADGLNADDDVGDRPGVRAAHERRVRSPLREAGLTKAHVRLASFEFGLSTADKPATPCLASRVPHGTAVTAARLGQIERAEASLRALGFDDLRVRHHGAAARIELAADDDVARALHIRDDVVRSVRGAGFATVLIDLDGRGTGGADRAEPRVVDLASARVSR